MRRSVLLAATLFLGLATPALAKALSAAEAKKVFFGLDMTGVYEADGTPWRECVKPNGETIYWYRGTVDLGRLTIRNDGALCFAYKSSDYSQVDNCYTATRQGGGYRFTHVADPTSVFVAKQAKSIKACPDPDAPTV
jgi:hypothetical protein